MSLLISRGPAVASTVNLPACVIKAGSQYVCLPTALNSNYIDCECQCFIDWTFYKKDASILTKEYIYEPRRVSAIKVDDWFQIKLLTKNKNLILETYNQKNL